MKSSKLTISALSMAAVLFMGGSFAAQASAQTTEQPVIPGSLVSEMQDTMNKTSATYNGCNTKQT